ncbi:MAG: hypothetical protein AAF687_09395 [Pseudomonadota bacterium]
MITKTGRRLAKHTICTALATGFLALPATVASAQAQQASNGPLFAKLSGESFIRVFDKGKACTLEISAIDPSRMAVFSVGGAELAGASSSMARFSSKRKLLTQGGTRFIIRIFRGGEWLTPRTLPMGIFDEKNGVHSNISLNPAVDDIVWDIRQSTMLHWSLPRDLKNAQMLSYKSADIFAASLVLDSCKKKVEQRRKEKPQEGSDFDWLIPGS